MNLAADTSNRRSIREQGGVEALVEVLKVAPLSEPVRGRRGRGAGEGQGQAGESGGRAREGWGERLHG